MNTVKVRNIEIGAGIPKICVPIVGVTREEILAAAENIKSTKADVVEWRVDWYEDIFDFAKTEATMQALREADPFHIPHIQRRWRKSNRDRGLC